MRQRRPGFPPSKQRLLALLFCATVIVGGVGWLVNRGLRQQRHVVVAARGAAVMPFDLDQTIHVFERSPTGGHQSVTALNPSASDQVRLIREHLRQETDKFSRGDFLDPAAIHGEDMPGLAELRRGATAIDVRYDDLADGGKISYVTTDPALVQAIHRWFQAQQSDDGKHARPNMSH